MKFILCTLIIIGVIYIGLEIMSQMTKPTHVVRGSNTCRRRVKTKPRRYQCYYTPSSTIRIANEFYNYSKSQERKPIRKATGLFSDESAQKIIRKTEGNEL